MAEIGRPTLYKPEYCELLIEHMAGGLSYESFAGVVRVSKQTIYDWEKANQAFLDAKKVAFELNRLYWEKQGIDGLYATTEYGENGKPIRSKSMNATVWVFNMKNRFPSEWREKQPGEDDHTVTHKIGSLSDEQLDERQRQIEAELKQLKEKQGV